MVSYAFNNRFSQLLLDGPSDHESFTRDDGIHLLNTLLTQIGDYQLNIKTVVDRFIPAEQEQIDLAVITCIVFHLSYLDQPVNCEVVKLISDNYSSGDS